MTRGELAARPVSQAARDRLRAQGRREQDLAARVIAAEARLTAEISKRDALVTARDRVVDNRRDGVADALIAYVEEAGMGIERAALILGREKSEVARLVHARRAVLRHERETDAKSGLA